MGGGVIISRPANPPATRDTDCRWLKDKMEQTTQTIALTHMRNVRRPLPGFRFLVALLLAVSPVGAQAASDADWVNVGDVLDVEGGYVTTTVADSFGNLYIGGLFNRVGGVSATNVAKWNGTTWSALGSGAGSRYSRINALAVSGSNLYVGGQFDMAGGNAATNLVKWNGSAWSSLGTGLNGDVYALAASGSDLYVGGYFTSAGGKSANHIAKWNGSTWSSLGAGLNDGVWALAVLGGNLYAGGYFSRAGVTNANRVAKWNGSAWSALGAGLNGTVYALAVSGSNLYVGGIFTTAGGSNVNRVARWNGNTWSALGNGVQFASSPFVAAIAVSGSNLYVGGDFLKAGESGASRVAKWNGNTWSPLGSGVSGGGALGPTPIVLALTILGSDLYVGGYFTVAGGKSAFNFARVVGPSVFTSIVPDPSTNQALLTFESSPGASLNLLSSTNLATWQTNTTVTATNVTNSVSVNLTQPQEFFRLQRLP